MELHIKIEGAEGTGKSTIAKIIADALSAHNIPCEADDGQDGNYGKWQADKLAAIHKRKDFIVKIKTVTPSTKMATDGFIPKSKDNIPVIISPGECTFNSNPNIPDDLYKKINGC